MPSLDTGKFSEPIDDHVVFLLGAGRSGTTLLYKLLCLHDQVVFFSNYDRVFPPAFAGIAKKILLPRSAAARYWAWFEGRSAYVEARSLFKRFVPAPVEGEAMYSQSGFSLSGENEEVSAEGTEKLRSLVRDLLRGGGGQTLVSKRTANNRRVLTLLEIFPNARFIRLTRDGRDVAQSLSEVAWWADHRLWWADRTPRELRDEGEDMLSICARNWLFETDLIDRDLLNVPESNQVDLSYEDLLSDPLAVFSSLMGFLGLDVYPELETTMKRAGLRPAPSRWKMRWTPAQYDQVLGIIGPKLEQYGYI